jgi:chromosome segregation ATPase
VSATGSGALHDFFYSIPWHDAAFVLGFIGMIYQLGKFSNRFGSLEHSVQLLGVTSENLKLELGSINTKIEGLNAKIDSVKTELNTKIEQVSADLNKRIDSVQTSMEKKIEQVSVDLNKRIDSVQTSMEKKIEQFNADLNKRIDAIQASMEKKIDHAFFALDKRMDGLERRIEHLDDKIDAMNKEIGQVTRGLVVVEKDINVMPLFERMAGLKREIPLESRS